MAEQRTGDIIIDVLLNAGLRLKEDDVKDLQRRLALAGQALGEGGADAIKEIQRQAAELDKTLRNLKGRRDLLERAARKDFDPLTLTKGKRRSLAAGFEDAKVADRELGNLINQIKALGKAGDDLFFNELKSLETTRKQFSALATSAAKNIDGVGLELQRNLKAEREQKRRDAAAAKQEALNRNQRLRSEELKRGKQVFREGKKSDFVGITDKRDAQEALKFARAQQKYMKDTVDLMVKGSDGKETPEIRRARRDELRQASHVAALTDRIRDLGDLEATRKRDDAQARRIAKAEADYATSRSIRGSRDRQGFQALAEGGGIFAGNASRYNSPEKLARAMKFVNAELNDSKKLFTALRDELGETHPRVLRMAGSLQRMGGLLADMGDRDDFLKAVQKGDAELKARARREQAELDKWLQTRGELEQQRKLGLGPRTPLEEVRDSIQKGREVRVGNYVEQQRKQAEKDEAALQAALGKMQDRDLLRQRGVGPLTPLEEARAGVVRGRETVAAADLRKQREQQAKDEAILQKRLGEMEELERQRRLGTGKRTPLEEARAGVVKGRELAVAAELKQQREQQAKDEAALQKRLGEMEALDRQRRLGTAPLTPLEQARAGIDRGRGAAALVDRSAQAKLARADRSIANERAKDPEAFRLFGEGLLNPATLTTSKETARALQAGSKELSAMRTKQEALVDAAQEGTAAYRQLVKEIERAQKAMGNLRVREAELKETEARTPRVSARSSIYTTGREAFETNVGRAGGLEGLRGEAFDQAKSFARARLRETQQSFDALSRSGTASSQQLRDAADQVLHYEDALRRLNSSAGAAASRMEYLTNVFKMFVKYAVAYQSLYALMAAFGALSRAVINLQTDMLDIQAITGSSTAEMEKLGTVVQSVAENSKFSLDELTKATKTLAQAGVPIADLNSTLQATANFAAATGTSLETAADIVSTMRDVFKELNDDVIANQLARAINISKLTGEGLRTIMSLGAQTAKDFNISSEQFLAAVSSLRNAGLKDSTTATGLRQAMLEIFTPDNTLITALQTRYKEIGESLGAEAIRQRFFSFTQASNPLVAALQELKRLGFNDEGEMVLTRAFDIRSSNAIRAMISNLEELSQFEGEITFGRAAADGARITIDGLNASWTRLMSTITGFTYDRSGGIIGFLTETIQGLDRAIQRWEYWQNLRDASVGLTGNEQEDNREAGLTPDSQPDNRSPGQRAFDQFFDAATFKSTRDELQKVLDLFDPKGAELRDIRTNIAGTNRSINQAELSRESFVKEADQFDINRALAGNAPGTGADQIVKAAKAARDFREMAVKSFGPEMAANEKALRELIHSYTDLTQSQREVREKELRAQFPALGALKEGEFDKVLFDLSGLQDTVQGKLTALKIGLNKELEAASVTVRQLGGRNPENAAEFAAVTQLKFHKLNETLQRVMEGTSGLAVEEQIKVISGYGQQVADDIRTKGGELSDKTLVKQQVTNLRNISKELFRTTDFDSGQVEFRAAVSRVLSAQKDSADATLKYLTLVRDVMLEMSKGMDGAGSALFTQGVLQAQRAVDAAAEAAKIDEARRIKLFREKLLPTLADPNYKKSVESLPETDPKRDALLNLISKPPTEGEAYTNSDVFKLLESNVVGYLTREKEMRELNTREDEKRNRRYALEEKRGDARTRFGELEAGNHFAGARQAKAEEIGATVEILQIQLAEKKLDYENNRVRQDPEGIKENLKLREEIAGIENEIKLAQKDLSRSVAKLDQEEAVVNNRRQTNAAKGEQTRLTGALSVVGIETSLEDVEKLINAYDANQTELNDLLEERKQLEGDMSAEARAELEEQQRKLLKYKDQNAYLDLLQRREVEIRRRLNDELEKPLTTGDATEDARLNELGIIPGSRTDRSNYLAMQAALVAEQMSSAQRQLATNEQARSDAEQFISTYKEGDEGYEQALKNREEAARAISDLNAEIDGYRVRIGELRNELNNVRQTFKGALDQAFDLDTIILGLEQAESSVENLAQKIHNALIAGIEGVGDAFADALLEGEDFFDSLDKLFSDTGKQIVRDAIKTYTTETITGFLKGFSPKAREDAGQSNPVGDPLGGGLFGLLGKGIDYLKGGSKEAPAATGAQPNYGVGGGPLVGPSDEAPAGGVLMSAVDYAGNVLQDDKPGDNTVLADAAKGESKGFFDALLSGFSGIWDTLSSGFGSALKSIGGLLGMGGGGGGGGANPLGLLTAMIPGFKYGGIIKTVKAASGGVIVGRGTGTSDSVPGFIRSKNGTLHPLLTSNGESILNAKATSLLGADAIHALNSGNFVRADTSNLARDSARLMAAVQPGAGNSQRDFARAPVKQFNTTQVAVTPAQMRMRMGDWLDQHVIEELSKR